MAAGKRRVLFLILFALAVPAAAADCLSLKPEDQNSLPLTVTQADPVPGSVRDGLLVRTAGAIHTVSLELRVRPDRKARPEDAISLEEVHVGPLLPSSGFPVFWLDETTGDAVEVGDGSRLPLEKLRAAGDRERIRVRLFAGGPGGGFAGKTPVPIIVLGFTGAAGTMEILNFQAFGPDGEELTSLFEVQSVCLKPACEPRVIVEDEFDVDLKISLPETEPGSIDEGLLLQTAGEIQSGDFELTFDPAILVLKGMRVGSFFVRPACPVVFAPAKGPGEVLTGPTALIAAGKVLKEPGRILFGLAALGLCPPEPPAPGVRHTIATFLFALKDGLPRHDDIETSLVTEAGTVLFGSDGAPEVTFFRRVGACFLFPGLCATQLACTLTADCLGARLVWTNTLYTSVDVYRDEFLLQKVLGGVRQAVDPVAGPGRHTYKIVGMLAGEPCDPVACEIVVPRPLRCPESFVCDAVSREVDGNLTFQFAWTNTDAYDFLELRAGGKLVALAGPSAQGARLTVNPRREPIPTEFTLRAGHGGKFCAEILCTLLPFCFGDFVCSQDPDGNTRFDWTGPGGLITVRSVDLATGKIATLAEDAPGLASFVDRRAPGPLGTRYIVSAVSPASGVPCGFGSCIAGARDFVRGDFSADGDMDLTDVIGTLEHLFRAGDAPPCAASADTNGDGAIDITDAIGGLFFMYQAGPPPPPPFPGCGPDAEGTGLPCASFAPCPGKDVFPGALTCSVDGASANVLVSWRAGQGLETLTIKLGSGQRASLGPAAAAASLPIPLDGYGQTLAVLLEASLPSGGTFARSCAVDIPAAPACPQGLTLRVEPGSGLITAEWTAGGVSATIRNDTGLQRTAGPGASSATFPIEPGDAGRVVKVDLTAGRPFGGPCPALSAQVNVPLPFGCIGAPNCTVDSLRSLIDVRFTPGVNLPDLEIQKGDAEPVALDPGASQAVVAIAEEDRGKGVTVTLRTSSPDCPARSCSVIIPADPIACFGGLVCPVDTGAGVIRVSWQPAENLASLLVEKDGQLLQRLPSDAERVNVVIEAADRGRDVKLTLRGLNTAGQEACLALQCTASVPPLVTGCRPARVLNLGETALGRNDDPGSTDGVAQYSCAVGSAEEGPEFAYVFTAQQSERVRIRLVPDTRDLDLFILDAAAPCDGSACIAAGGLPGTLREDIVVSVEGGKTYFIVVDSPGVVSGYSLSIDVFTESPCQFARSIFCGAAFPGSNDNFGSTNQRLTYSCSQTEIWEGPEFAYLFSLPERQRVTIDLMGLGADLDLFVLKADQPCGEGACVAASANAGAANEQATFIAAVGQNYFVVVDGWAGAVSQYQISMGCQPAVAEFRRGDANADGQVDINDGAFLLGVVNGQQFPRCQDACDIDDNGSIEQLDANLLLNYLFGGGQPPQPPFPDCGEDPTADGLGCDEPGPCHT